MSKNKQEIVEVPKEEVAGRLLDGEKVWTLRVFIAQSGMGGIPLLSLEDMRDVNIGRLSALIKDEHARFFAVREVMKDDSD
jgi:hypothetical protein